MATPSLPFHHPDRRTANCDDVPAVVAEVQRLIELMRTDVEMTMHAYGHSMAKMYNS